jgi:outer membrane protein assembly factor BamB
LSPDGSRVYLTGWTETDYAQPPGFSFDFATLAYDSATGALLWSSEYEGTGAFADVATAIAASPDGSRVYVTGYSYGKTYDYATVAYDATTGDEIWTARYRGPGQHIDMAHGVAIAPDGTTVYVTGESYTGAETGYDAVTVAYDAGDGGELWVSALVGERNYEDAGSKIAVTPDGEAVVVGGTLGPESDWAYGVAAYEAATGSERWRTSYSSAGNHSEILGDLVLAPDGSRIYVTGEGYRLDSDITTLAFDAASGAQLWRSSYDRSEWDDQGLAVAVSPDGKTVFAGGSSLEQGAASFVGEWDYATIAYDAATGTERWVSRFDGELRGDDYLTDLVASPDGQTVYAVGTSNNVPSPAFGIFYDIVTVAYDAASGDQSWTARHDGGDQDAASAVVAGPSRIHVAGTTFSPLSGYDYLTAAYDA